MSVDGMSLSQLVLWFFIYSFLGWAMECCVIRKERGYWENRGFVKLPFCVIYGAGTYLAIHLFHPIRENMIYVYIAGCIGATLFEYLTARLMMKLFGEIWWDYTNHRFNYKGILCLESTLAWGFLAVFIFGFLNNHVETLVTSMNQTVVMGMALVLSASYFLDFVYHFHLSLKNKDSEEEDEDAPRSTRLKF
ncbi:MAG: putative ABC transporter permease [Lachnospiraceae bacterium]|nr:putative ABC transporter permease [Lachnospiraceae bacterium]